LAQGFCRVGIVIPEAAYPTAPHSMALAILKGAGLALVACSLGQVMALPEEPTCFVTGRGYNDPKRNNTGAPNGLFQVTALLCQQLCNRTAYCDRFTWYNDSLGCWLQGDHDVEIEFPHAVSGPVRCPTVTEPENTSVVTDREFTVDKETPAKKEDGGFPIWIIILALLALLALGAAVWYCMNSEDKKKKKKKTVKKETPAAREMEEGTPLVVAGGAAAPAATALPLQAAYYAPTAQVAAPMMMTSGASVASPVAYTAAPQYSYQQTTSRQMMMPMAQPMQAPMQMVATQPAANDLFNQFDANGDGVLSREEMNAAMASLQQQR